MEQRAHSLASDTHSRGGRMSEPFGQCMNDISSTLKAVYKAHSAVVIPGSGSVRLFLPPSSGSPSLRWCLVTSAAVCSLVWRQSHASSAKGRSAWWFATAVRP